jgi:hypothetical protein
LRIEDEGIKNRGIQFHYAYIENAGLSDFLAVILKRERQRRNTLRIFSNRPSEIIFSGKTNP